MMTNADVRLWGRSIGAVSWSSSTNVASFEYLPEFVESSIEVAPLTMPLANRIYSFPALSKAAFHGLPGLLADSLPDKFGNKLIDAWLVKQGRSPASFNPVERLSYVGNRAMGAIEYIPSVGPSETTSQTVEVGKLVELAQDILAVRKNYRGSFLQSEKNRSIQEILRVGTSAGGARAKAIIAWNPSSSDVRSGQVESGDGYSCWILKFDGVNNGYGEESPDAAGFGLIEYAYYKMAKAAGIQMMASRLLEENGRSHFMTKRFDRTDAGGKIHMQTLGAISHFDYTLAGAYSYEQCFAAIRKLDNTIESIEEQFRRMTFNIVARNQDDHVKNIAFLIDRRGDWKLAPAYDLTYSYNPYGEWTSEHQMSLNGKRDHFELSDFKACARFASMQRGRAEQIIDQVQCAVRQWKAYAEETGVSDKIAEQIYLAHRTGLLK